MKKKILDSVGFVILILSILITIAFSSYADQSDVLDGVYVIYNNYTDTYYSSTSRYVLRSQIVKPNFFPQLSQLTFGNDSNIIHNYWKITHLENGEYVLCSLANEDRVLNYSGGSVLMTEFESNIPDSARWYIQGNYIKPKSDTGKCLTITNQNPTQTTDYDSSYPYRFFDLTVRTIGDMAFEKWTFEQTNLDLFLFRNDNTEKVSTSITATLNIAGFSASINDFGYTLLNYKNGIVQNIPTWSSSSTSVATINSSGVITPISAGTTLIRGTNVFGETVEITLTVVIADCGITEGAKYYIMSGNTKRYLSLTVAQDVDSVGIFTRTKSDNKIFKWTVQKQSNSKYKIINNVGTATRVLTASGTNLCISSDAGLSTQKFSIYRIDQAGDNQGLYYIKYGSYYLKENSNYNVTLTSSKSEATAWSFMEVEKGNASLFTTVISSENFDTTAGKSDFDSKMSSLGYNSDVDLINKTPAIAYSHLINSDVFVFRGHGTPGCINFYDDSDSLVGKITINSSVDSGTQNRYLVSCSANQLSSLRCVLYLGCNTGVDYQYSTGTYLRTYNLVTATYQKGAHFVLGTTEKVYTLDSDEFLLGFLEKANEGNFTIDECVYAGLVNAGIVSNNTQKFPIIYVGDTNQYLN